MSTEPDPPPGASASDLALDAELAATDDLLGGSLAQLLRPPADLEARTQQRAASDLMNRSLVGTSAGLLAVGWETLRFLAGRPDPEEGSS